MGRVVKPKYFTRFLYFLLDWAALFVYNICVMQMKSYEVEMDVRDRDKMKRGYCYNVWVMVAPQEKAKPQ